MATNSNNRDRICWSDVPCVFVPIVRPRCPECFGDEFIHIRSESSGDGSTTERAICSSCSTPFKIVREPALPEPGNCDTDTV